MDQVEEPQHDVTKHDFLEVIIPHTLVDFLAFFPVEQKFVSDPLLWDDVVALSDGELVLAVNGIHFSLSQFMQGFQH